MKCVITKSQLKILKENIFKKGYKSFKTKLVYLLIIGTITLGTLGIFMKSDDTPEDQYYLQVLLPAMQQCSQKHLEQLGKQVGTDNIKEYVRNNPNEFGLSQENAEIVWLFN